MPTFSSYCRCPKTVYTTTIISTEKGIEIAKTIREFLKIECDLGKLSEAILNFTNQKNINQFASVIKMASTFSEKINQGLSNKNINFKTDFGHSIEYYDGIMFEVKDRKNKNFAPTILVISFKSD